MERGPENMNICSEHSHLTITNLENSNFPRVTETLDDPLCINRRASLYTNDERRAKGDTWHEILCVCSCPSS